MENEVKKSAGKVWLIPTIVAAVLLIGLVVFMVIMGKGTSALADGTVTLSEAVSPLQDGTAQLSDGVDQYTEGVDTMNEAMPTLQDGVTQYTEGVDQLNGYMKKLNAAAPELASGVKQLADGSAQLDAAYNDINSIADTVAASMNSVRPTVNANPKYQELVAGANLIASMTGKDGDYSKGVNGLRQVVDLADANMASLVALSKPENSAQLTGLTSTFANSAVAEASTIAAAVAADRTVLTSEEKFATKSTTYQTLAANATTKSMASFYYGYFASLALNTTSFGGPTADAMVYNTGSAGAFLSGVITLATGTSAILNTPNAEMKVEINGTKTALTPVQFAEYMDEKATPMVAAGAAQVAAGIPALIDNICTTLEQGAAAQVDTTNPKSLKSSLKTYSDGVRAVAKGTSDLNKAVNGKDGLVSSVAQLYKDGSAKLAENSQALRDGVKQLADGAKKLSENSQALRDGASQLKDAAPALIDGIGQLVDGAKKVNGFTPIH